MMTVMSERSGAKVETVRRRRLVRIAIGVVALVVLAVAGLFVYAKFINDAPSALDEGDLSDALVTITQPDGTVSNSAGSVATTDAAAPTSDDFDGDWLATEASEFGYRVKEVLAGVDSSAVGRSNQIRGTLTIDGTTATAIDMTVDVATIESDDGLRDGKFRGDIMNTAEFPTASFTLTEPINFASIPTGAETITATAIGDLTLRGVTNSVTFVVTAQTTSGRIGVLGSIPVVFADYGIENPSFGPVRTEDDGLVEFVLVFERA